MKKRLNIFFGLTLFLFSLMASANMVFSSELSVQEDLSSITKRVYPSVVKVEVRNGIRKVATGVVIDKNGHIVTTALISPRNEKIYVISAEGKKTEAEFLGMDSMTNLAVVKAKEGTTAPIQVGKNEDVSTGSWIGVVSISPENTPAVTQGIVSSISPEVLRLNVWVVGGSSGSPVVDKKGNMIGLLRGAYADTTPLVFEMNEKEFAGSGYIVSQAEAPASGMARAIPVDIVVNIANEIKEKGKVDRGWLGVSIAENEEGQVEIVDIEKESPAELAKLEKGDIIFKFEGKDVTSTEMLAHEIKMCKPKDDVSMSIQRKGDTKKVNVKLGEYTQRNIFQEFEVKFPKLFPPQAPKPAEPFKAPDSDLLRRFYAPHLESRKYIGVYLDELTEELSAYFGVKEGKGLLVSRLTKDGPAEKAGLKVGDVIVKAEGKEVNTVQELSKIIQGKEKGSKIKVEFIRDKKSKTADVEVIEEEQSGLFFNSFNWDDQKKNWEDMTKSWIEQNEKLKDTWKEYQELFKKKKKEDSNTNSYLKSFFKEYRAIKV
jgi:S1-C subfamily serine protease